jgi:hypothetical protein
MVQRDEQRWMTSEETSRKGSTQVVRVGIMMAENQSGSGAREQSYEAVSQMF